MVFPLLTGSALAEECQQASFADPTISGTALATKKIHFLDDKGAPTSSYVLKGDEVIIVSQQASKACVEFASVKGDARGWIALSDLGPVHKPPTSSSHWTGTFQRDELGSFIELKSQKNNKIAASGEAYWAMSLESAKAGGASDGGIEDSGEVKDGTLHIGAPEKDGVDCGVDLRLLSDRYLLASNQGVGYGDDAKASSCWGHNVTFEGLYVRVKK